MNQKEQYEYSTNRLDRAKQIKSDYSFEETDESETQENYNIAVEFLKQTGELVQRINEGSVKF